MDDGHGYDDDIAFKPGHGGHLLFTHSPTTKGQPKHKRKALDERVRKRKAGGGVWKPFPHLGRP